MTRRLELDLAWRYLRSRRGSRLLSFITVIAMAGVIVGVSALVVIMGVMNGLQTDLREKILVASPDLRVLNFGEELIIRDWEQLLARVRNMDGVVSASPFVMTEAVGQVVDRRFSSGMAVVGLPRPDSAHVPVTEIRSKATAGDFTFATADGQRRGIVLGHSLAARFNAGVGAPFRLYTVDGAQISPVTGGIVPRVVDFEVTGIFETGMFEYDDKYAFIDMERAQDLRSAGNAVTGLDVRTADRWSAPALAMAIADSLGYPYRTVDWQQQNNALFKALKLEKLGMAVILGLISLVAAFNIVSTLTMVVRDKQREIGILKAMGLGSAAVRRVFLWQGAVIGCVGTLIGLALGLGTGVVLDRYRLITLDPQVYFIDHLPVLTDPLEVVAIALLSVAVATAATMFPARQAAGLYPVEAIRSE
ncbi:MAG: ABC transporter permease [Gemmatimonadetes bacterium]|nr:ABC transporter permease [Gemmatimonadota bacterium]